jgi:hypothetical protein
VITMTAHATENRIDEAFWDLVCHDPELLDAAFHALTDTAAPTGPGNVPPADNAPPAGDDSPVGAPRYRAAAPGRRRPKAPRAPDHRTAAYLVRAPPHRRAPPQRERRRRTCRAKTRTGSWD